jgi:multiple sugar transport system ATP-binding protein
MAEVVLDQVSKLFGSAKAVDNISLRIADGEFFTLLGPSGCGKTTTLRLVAGLELADAGTIRIGERDVTRVPPAERRIAMVFQNYALYPHMTIAENISYPLRLRKVPVETRTAKIRSVSEKLRIGQLLDRMPAQISGGQQQRVAVARAMVQDPLVYLFDEPLSNLDAKLRLEARRFLKHLQRETGVTAIYVTHDQTEAMALSDRVAVLKDGRLAQVAPPEEIYHQPANAFVAGFVGSPPMNLIEGKIEGTGFVSGKFSVELDQVKKPGPGSMATLGIRPEHIRLSPPGASALAGVVDDVEPLGNEQIVTVVVAEVPLLVRVIEPTPPRPGDRVSIHFEPSALHLFGPDGTRAG